MEAAKCGGRVAQHQVSRRPGEVRQGEGGRRTEWLHLSLGTTAMRSCDHTIVSSQIWVRVVFQPCLGSGSAPRRLLLSSYTLSTCPGSNTHVCCPCLCIYCGVSSSGAVAPGVHDKGGAKSTRVQQGVLESTCCGLFTSPSEQLGPDSVHIMMMACLSTTDGAS